MLGIERLELRIDLVQIVAGLLDSILDYSDRFGDVDLLHLLLVDAAPYPVHPAVKALQLILQLGAPLPSRSLVRRRPGAAMPFGMGLGSCGIQWTRKDDGAAQERGYRRSERPWEHEV